MQSIANFHERVLLQHTATERDESRARFRRPKVLWAWFENGPVAVLHKLVRARPVAITKKPWDMRLLAAALCPYQTFAPRGDQARGGSTGCIPLPRMRAGPTPPPRRRNPQKSPSTCRGCSTKPSTSSIPHRSRSRVRSPSPKKPQRKMRLTRSWSRQNSLRRSTGSASLAK